MRKGEISPHIFNIPLYVTLSIMVIFPLVAVFILSLNRWQINIGNINWVGIDNYIELIKNKRFINAIGHNFYFTVIGTTLQLILGFGIALILNKNIRGARTYRALIMLPMMCAPVVVALTWRFMLNSSFGIINLLIKKMGLESISFLGSKNLVIPTLILVDTWQWTPYIIIILLAGLQSLPRTPIEAAKIEGANSIQTFLYIIFPLMRPHLGTALILKFVIGFKIFDLVWAMTRGGPMFASETIYSYIYSQSFLYFRIGYSSASAVVFLIAILSISFSFYRIRGGRK